jgi:hypothetical protein
VKHPAIPAAIWLGSLHTTLMSMYRWGPC